MTGIAAPRAALGSEASPPGLAARGVVKRFPIGGRAMLTVLDGISFDCAAGAFVSLLGPSGCGKTTLLRMFADLETPTQGAVRLHGASPRSLREGGRLGIAFQDAALLPWRSVAANIRLPLDLAGETGRTGEVADLVALMGLRGFEQAPPHRLSGGMRQRVSLARALVRRPDVLLLDEPFGALDAITRRRLNLELERVWRERAATTLLVTHSVVEAVLLSDLVLILCARPGRLAAAVEIALPRPRTEALLKAPEFHGLCADIEDLLACHALDAAT